MKTKLTRISKRSLSTVLAILMIFSTLMVGTITANAWDANAKGHIYFAMPYTWTSNNSSVQYCIVKNDLTRVQPKVTLNKISNTDLYYGNGTFSSNSYGDQYDYAEIIANGNGWGDFDNYNNSSLSHYTTPISYKCNNTSYYYRFYYSDTGDKGIGVTTGNSNTRATALNIKQYVYAYTDLTRGGTYSNNETGGKVVVTYRTLSADNTSQSNTFDTSSESGSDYYTVPAELTLVATPNTGYEFVGWYTAASGGSALSTDSSAGRTVDTTTLNYHAVTSDYAIYARFRAKQYSITYKDGGNTAFSGTHASGYPTTHTYGTATTLKSASKTGYTFGGWYTNSGCTGSAVTSLGATSYTNNITLYAKWTANDYDVTLNTNGGTINSGNVTSYTYGVGATLPSDITKTGHTFGGWYDNSSLTGSAVTSIGTTATGDKEYWAKWTANTYNISYTGDNISYTSNPDTGTYGSTVSFNVAGTGDYVVGEVTGTYVDSNSQTQQLSISGSNGSYSFTMPAGAVTISTTAVRAPKTVSVTMGSNINSYVVNGTTYTGAHNFTVSSGSAFTITSVSYATGYESDNNTLSIASVTEDTSISLAAKQTVYTITQNTSTHGSYTISKSSNVHYQDEITITPSPDSGYSVATVKYNDGSDHVITYNSGYKFTMPASDVSITVTFSEDMHTVSVVSGNAVYGSVDTNLVTVGKYTQSSTITASANTGYHFVDWTIPSGVQLASGYSATDAAIKINATADSKTITANFAKNTYTLTVSVQNGFSAGQGYTISGNSASYEYGDAVSFTITAKTGYNFPTVAFDGVTATVSGTTTKTYSFNMPANNVTVSITPNQIVPEASVNYKTYSNGDATSTTSATVTKRLAAPTFTLTNYASYPSGAEFKLYKGASEVSDYTFSSGTFTLGAHDSVGTSSYTVKVTYDGHTITSNAISVTTNDYVELTVPNNVDGTVAVTYTNDCGTTNQTANSGGSTVYVNKGSAISATATFVNPFGGIAKSIKLKNNGTQFAATTSEGQTTLTGSTTLSANSTITAEFVEDDHQTIYLKNTNLWTKTNIYAWYKNGNTETPYVAWASSYQINQSGAGHTATFQYGDSGESRTYYVYKLYKKDTTTYDKWNKLVFSSNKSNSDKTADTDLVNGKAYELSNASGAKTVTDTYNAENFYSVYLGLQADDEAGVTYANTSSAGTITSSNATIQDGYGANSSKKRVITGSDQETVTLTATAETGYTFQNWTLGDGVTITSGTTSSASITIKSSQVSEVTAIFEHTKYYPTYPTAPNGEYTITGPAHYYYNSNFTFTITPSNGYGIETVTYKYNGTGNAVSLTPSGNNYTISSISNKNVTIYVSFIEVSQITYYVDMHDIPVASGATMMVQNVTDDSGNTVCTNINSVPYQADIAKVGSSTVYSGTVATPEVGEGEPLYVKITIGSNTNVLELDYNSAVAHGEVWVELVKRGYTESHSTKTTYSNNLTDDDHRRIVLRRNWDYFTDGDGWDTMYAITYQDGVGSSEWKNLNYLGYNSGHNHFYYVDIHKNDNRILIKNKWESKWYETPVAVIDEHSLYQLARDADVYIQRQDDEIVFPHISKYESDVYLDKDTTDTFVLDRSGITGAAVVSTLKTGSGVITFNNSTGQITPLTAGTATIETKVYSSFSMPSSSYGISGYNGDVQTITTTVHVYDSKEITGFALMSYESNTTTFAIKNATGGELTDITTKLSGVGGSLVYTSSATHKPGIITETGSGTSKTYTVKYAKPSNVDGYSNITMTATIKSVPVEATSGQRYGFKRWLVGDTPQTISTSTTRSEHYYERVTTSSNISANGSAYLAEYIQYIYTDVHFTYNYYEYKTNRTAGTGIDGTAYEAGNYYQYDTNYVTEDRVSERFAQTHNLKHFDEVIEFRAVEYDSQRANYAGQVLDVSETDIIQALAIANFHTNLKNDYYDYSINASCVGEGSKTSGNIYDMYVTVNLNHSVKHYSVTYNGSTQRGLTYQQYVTVQSSDGNVKDWYEDDTETFLGRGSSYRFRVTKDITLETRTPADQLNRVGLKSTIDHTGYELSNEDFVKQGVTYTNAEVIRQNFYIADFYNDKMATYEDPNTHQQNYYDDVTFVGGGVAYFSVDSSGNMLKLNQKYRTTVNDVEVADKEAIAAAIKGNIEAQALPADVTEDTDKTIVYGTEIQPTADQLYGSSSGLVYRYMPYNKYQNGSFVRQTDTFRYSNALGAYQYIYHTKDLNLEKNDGKIMRMYSYYVYSFTSYYDENGEETGGHTEYRVVISDNYSDAATYVSAS